MTDISKFEKEFHALIMEHDLFDDHNNDAFRWWSPDGQWGISHSVECDDDTWTLLDNGGYPVETFNTAQSVMDELVARIAE